MAGSKEEQVKLEASFSCYFIWYGSLHYIQMDTLNPKTMHLPPMVHMEEMHCLLRIKFFYDKTTLWMMAPSSRE